MHLCYCAVAFAVAGDLGGLRLLSVRHVAKEVFAAEVGYAAEPCFALLRRQDATENHCI